MKNFQKKMGKALRDYYGLWIAAVFLLAVAVFYAIVGGNARIAVPDNLDLFQAQYKMLKNTDTFFSQNASVPFLHGISRDVLPSELSLTALFYEHLPAFTAYIAVYLSKVIIAVLSFMLLAWELMRRGLLQSALSDKGAGSADGWLEAHWDNEGRDGRFIREEKGSAVIGCRTNIALRRSALNLSALCGLAFGMLNLFPSFGISFAAIPLLLFLVLRLDAQKSLWEKGAVLFLIFCYPFLSYFSYIGIFLIFWLFVGFVWTSIAQKRVRVDLALAVAALSLGSIFFEYRLFRLMFASAQESIRSTMVIAPMGVKEVLFQMANALWNGGAMHTQSMQQYIVFPVCAFYLCVLVRGHIKERTVRALFGDIYWLGSLMLIFNAAMYGLYYWAPFRNFVGELLPPLKGFQFSRFSFLNPFLWYGLFFVCLYRLSVWIRGHLCMNDAGNDAGVRLQTDGRGGAGEREEGRPADARGSREDGRTAGAQHRMPGRWVKAIPAVMSLAACAVILLGDTTYNDLYHTAHGIAVHALGRAEDDSLTYREFYAEDLFADIRNKIGYKGEWVTAYGFHPAILEYNGFQTVDGYLGFYSQDYKEQFRKVIAPALERQPASAAYYDNWGARCYLYSGTEATVVEAVRHYQHGKEPLYVDADALRSLGCRDIISRIEITNARELGMTLQGTYSLSSETPYTVYVYALN